MSLTGVTPDLLNKVLEFEIKLIYSKNPGLCIGPYLLGMVADALFLGILIPLFSQWWHTARKEDGRWHRWLVYYTFTVSLGMSGYCLAYVFFIFVYNYGHYAPFANNDWISAFYLLENVTRFPVTIFFILRAWRLVGRSWIFLVALVTLSVASSACCIASRVVSYDLIAKGRYVSPHLTDGLESILVDAWLCGLTATDLITTGTIAVSLFKSRTGWSHTDKLIWRLLFAIVFLATCVSSDAWTINAFFTCVPKTYAVCLLVVLNWRTNMRGLLEQGTSGTYRSKKNERSPVPHIEVNAWKPDNPVDNSFGDVLDLGADRRGGSFDLSMFYIGSREESYCL